MRTSRTAGQYEYEIEYEVLGTTLRESYSMTGDGVPFRESNVRPAIAVAEKVAHTKGTRAYVVRYLAGTYEGATDVWHSI